MYVVRDAQVRCFVLFGMLHLSCIDLVNLHESVDNEYMHAYLRQHQDGSCAKKYSEITDGHTACLPPTTSVSIGATGVSDSDKTLIIDIHNKVRSDVSPTARKMMKMSWDDEIADIAQRWAETCIRNHDKNYKRYSFGRFPVGQNIAWGSSNLDWTTAIQLWINEKDIYTLAGKNSWWPPVGHYTAMVWAETVKVGCGFAQCDGINYFVCNYGPAGNFDINNPYFEGPPCSECPNTCNNNLCDCGGKVCLNGGELDPNTCQCHCRKRYLTQPICTLNCTGIRQPNWCNSSKVSKSLCEKYVNFPYDCPVLCNMCPYAGSEYIPGNCQMYNYVISNRLHKFFNVKKVI